MEQSSCKKYLTWCLISLGSGAIAGLVLAVVRAITGI